MSVRRRNETTPAEFVNRDCRVRYREVLSGAYL
jgi:hypothetical protein